MKHLLLIFFFFNLFSGFTQVKVISYNIRYDNPMDGENRWELRKNALVKMLRDQHPDFLAIQEGLYHQVLFLDSMLPNHAYIGVGREDGKTKGEFSAIFYDSTKLKLLQQRTWWLSPTPDSVSVGWDAAMERIVSYGCFIHKSTKDTLYIFNTHYDHIGKKARENSSKLILSLINDLQLKDKQVILMGDFNSTQKSKPIKILTNYFHDPVQRSSVEFTGPKGTFNHFDTTFIPDKRIDFIFAHGLTILSYWHLNPLRENGLLLSDHLVVMALLKWKTGKNNGRIR